MQTTKYILMVSLVSFLAACGHGDNGSAGQDKVSRDSTAVSQYLIGSVGQGQLGATAELPGVLKPFLTVDIYPKVNGFIREIPVDRGSEVRTGQLLVRLEAPEIEQQYLGAKSRWLQAYSLYLAGKDDYDRLIMANKMPGTVSAHDLEAARAKMIADSATVQSEVANYKALEATKDYLMVTAPFNGVITVRNVHPGALVGPAQKEGDRPMLVLEQQEKLRLVIDVPEVYSNQLAPGAVVSFRVSTLPGKVFRSAISRSAGSLSMKYRSESVEVDVSNGDRLLKPGMYAEVELPVRRRTNSLIVPASAIVTSQEKRYVVKVQGGLARWVDVTEGNSRNDSTEVFGDLQLNDRIVVNANDEIRDGSKLE